VDHAGELFDLSADMLCVAGMDGYFRELNPAFERVLGYTAEEMMRRPFIEFVHPDDRAATLAEMEKLAAGAVTLHFENRYRRKDGVYRWLWWTSRPDTARGLLFAVARDVTERKELEHRLRRAEEELRASHRDLESQYEAVVRESGQLLYDWDAAANAVVYGNTERALGYTEEEMAWGPDRWLDLVHPDDREAFRRENARSVETGAPFRLEYRVRRKDGAYVQVEDRGYCFRDASGRVARVAGFVVDITERKSLEEQLRHAQKMEAVGRLAGGIAHDFNNLLTAIMGYSEFALAGMSAHDPLRSDIQQIRNAGDRAQALTHQLLTFSRKQILQPSVLDLNTVVAGLDHLLRRVIGEDIDLLTRLAPHLPSVRVDRGQIEQIVMNLGVNARDAMPRGGKLTIETGSVTLDDEYVRRHPEATPGPHVMLAVSDSGVGMDAATRSRIFEPFFTTKPQGKGTGLGLSTVYGIVKQSGGSIWVYSEPGRGATFKVYLPCVPGTSASPARGPVERSEARGTETILVVEDDDLVRGLVERVLRGAGYTVLSVSDVDAATERCQSHEGEIHLLLTDLVLPKVNGRELAESLSSLRPSMKLIFMSGYTDDAVVHHGLLAPEVSFLQKPLTPSTLLAKVRDALLARGRDRHEAANETGAGPLDRPASVR
jgi:PAS domain S-box-containing protein